MHVKPSARLVPSQHSTLRTFTFHNKCTFRIKPTCLRLQYLSDNFSHAGRVVALSMPPKRSSLRRAATVTAASASPRRSSTRATRQPRTSIATIPLSFTKHPIGTPTPPPAPDSSEEGEASPQPDPDAELQSQEDVDAESGAQDAEDADEGSDDQPVVVQRRRPGRPPRVRPVGWDAPEADGGDASESGTPGRRGRGRGRPTGWRGGPRGRGRKGAGIPTTKPPIDDEGNEMDVIDDEVITPEHVEGEKKVDKNGHLLGGREYRVRTFTIVGRKQRLYMLSTEPARCMGFRDSYLFFAKHKYLYKIIIGDEEKKDLIDREILPHSYKGRSIGVVTARSVYREFGSKIVVGGRKVIDDYNPELSRARGDVEGELADPYDRMPEKGHGYNRNQYVAWHGASSVYHSNAPMGPVGLPSLAGKKRGAITSANWMYEHAREASRFNSSLTMMRKATARGVYDTHTNVMCYPQIMQSRSAVWEEVEVGDEEPPAKKQKTEEVNGHEPALTNGLHEDIEMVDGQSRPVEGGLLKPSSFLRRNYLVIDTEALTPQHATWSAPDSRQRYPTSSFPDPVETNPPYDDGIRDNITDAGLWSTGPPSVPDDILATFPLDAREAYLREYNVQKEWQGLWSSSSAVRRPKIGIASMTGGG